MSSLTEQAISLTPNDAHVVLWPQGNVIKIFFGRVYRADTTYAATIDSTALDLDGNRLGERLSLSFGTSPVSVAHISPRNGRVFVANRTPIVMTFNLYVVKSSFDNSFNITPVVSGYFIYGYSGRRSQSKNAISFIPNGCLTLNTLNKVSIGTGTKDLYDTPLKTEYEFSIIKRRE